MRCHIRMFLVIALSLAATACQSLQGFNTRATSPARSNEAIPDCAIEQMKATEGYVPSPDCRR